MTSTVLPTLDMRNVRIPGPIIVGLTGMVVGNEGDLRTGDAADDYVHVTRTKNGFDAVHVDQRRGFFHQEPLKVAEWIVDRFLDPSSPLVGGGQP